MGNNSTILLRKDVINSLKNAREHPRQTYNELIEKMVRIFLKIREQNQYDNFLHKIQQEKMKELWNNKEDKDWENA